MRIRGLLYRVWPYLDFWDYILPRISSWTYTLYPLGLPEYGTALQVSFRIGLGGCRPDLAKTQQRWMVLEGKSLARG
jgi:hypothetical protein